MQRLDVFGELPEELARLFRRCRRRLGDSHCQNVARIETQWNILQAHKRLRGLTLMEKHAAPGMLDGGAERGIVLATELIFGFLQ